MMNKNGFLRGGALCGALAMLIVGGLVSCSLAAGGSSGKVQAISSETQEKLKSLKKLIGENYLYEPDEKALQSGIYKGYIEGLGDPYSEYYDEEETAKLTESTKGKYAGIGAVVSQNYNTGIVTLTRVYEDCPADKAGLKDGDILYKVEGKDISGKELEEVVGEIKGEEGTPVKLTVLRGKSGKEITVTVTRGIIEYPTVEHEMYAEDIGYLRISEFDVVTYDQFMEAYRDLTGRGMKGMVVDLRGNPGGTLQTVCNILDEILPEGLIVYTEDKNGNRREMTSDAARQIHIPMAVLVNQNSASASEIFAGAVQDYGLGEIVGMDTYGKGVVQQVYKMNDGTCVKLTVSEYFTPKGRSIDGVGIVPDVKVEYKMDEKHPDADNQLETAVKELRKNMGKE